MNPMLATWIFEQQLQQQRGAAEAARLVPEATPAGSERSPTRRLRLRARGCSRRQSTVPPAAPSIARRDAAGFADLADRLAAHGTRAVERDLAHLVEHARRHRVTPVLLSILADTDQPDVARARAFGRIVAELEKARRAASHPSIPVNNAA
jgi:hypothetical protein